MFSTALGINKALGFQPELWTTILAVQELLFFAN